MGPLINKVIIHGFGTHLGSMWGPCGTYLIDFWFISDRFGIHLEPIWGPSLQCPCPDEGAKSRKFKKRKHFVKKNKICKPKKRFLKIQHNQQGKFNLLFQTRFFPITLMVKILNLSFLEWKIIDREVIYYINPRRWKDKKSRQERPTKD